MTKKSKKTDIELFVINKVREKRLECDMAQEDIARILDTARGFIGQVESSNYAAKYNLNHLQKLAKEFGCSIGEFFPEK